MPTQMGPENRKAIVELSAVLAQRYAPDEVALLDYAVDATQRRLSGTGSAARSDRLGMGVGEMTALANLAAPLLLAAAEWAFNDVLKKGLSEVLVKKLKAAVEKTTSSEPITSDLTPDELVLAGSLLQYLTERAHALNIPDERARQIYSSLSAALVKSVLLARTGQPT